MKPIEISEKTCGENIQFRNKRGWVQVKIKTKHRIYNHSWSTLKIIEFQTGSSFGEDDIIRI